MVPLFVDEPVPQATAVNMAASATANTRRKLEECMF